MAMMSGGESGGKEGEPLCATGATIWISQTFNTAENLHYLPWLCLSMLKYDEISG